MHSIVSACFVALLVLPISVLAQQPFPIAASTFGPNQESRLNNDIQSYLATQTGAAAYATASAELASVTDVGLLYDFRGDPDQLAEEFFTAASTPTWYSELPTPLQAYVSSVAAQQAAIASSDAALTVSEPPTSTAGATSATASASATGKSGAERRVAGVAGAALAAGMVGVAML